MLVKHEFDCFGLGLRVVVRFRVINSFGVMVMVRVRVGIRVYVQPFCSTAKP